MKSENRAGVLAAASFSALKGVPESLFLRPPSHKPLGALPSLSFFRNLAMLAACLGPLGTPFPLFFGTFFQERFWTHFSVPRGPKSIGRRQWGLPLALP